jgi:hypothetical protein
MQGDRLKTVAPFQRVERESSPIYRSEYWFSDNVNWVILGVSAKRCARKRPIPYMACLLSHQRFWTEWLEIECRDLFSSLSFPPLQVHVLESQRLELPHGWPRVYDKLAVSLRWIETGGFRGTVVIDSTILMIMHMSKRVWPIWGRQHIQLLRHLSTMMHIDWCKYIPFICCDH